MNKQYALLLKKQLDKLRSEDFDLEAWKSASISVLTRVFGASDSKVKQIEDLRIDYGSWALRDAQGSYNPLQTCKKKGAELFEAAINELEILGLPDNNDNLNIEILTNALEQELRVSQFKSLKAILNSNKDEMNKESELIKMVESWGKTINGRVLAKLILNSNL